MKKLSLFLFILGLFCLSLFAQKPAKKPTPKPTPKKSVTQKITDTLKKTLNIDAPLSKFEQEVFDEINLVRTNPQEYVKHFEGFLKTFDGEYFKNSSGVQLIVKEGKKPVEEIIITLKKLKPLPKFQLSDGLSKAANDHTTDLTKNNKTGHRGTDGSFPQNRIERYGIVGSHNENISYYSKTPRDIVFNMLIDDGVASRSHRQNILSSSLKKIGISSSEHKEVERICVIVFADYFIEKKK